MEVVKRGTAPELTRYDAPCEVCQSEIRFTVLDGIVETAEGIRSLIVRCPVCQARIAVELPRERREP